MVKCQKRHAYIAILSVHSSWEVVGARPGFLNLWPEALFFSHGFHLPNESVSRSMDKGNATCKSTYFFYDYFPPIFTSMSELFKLL